MKIAIIAPSNHTGGAQKILINLNTIFNSYNIESKIIFLKGNNSWHGDNFQILKSNNLLAKFNELRKVINEYEPDIIISSPTHINIFVIILRYFTKVKPKLVLRQATHYSYEKNNNIGFTPYYLSLLSSRWLYQKSDMVISLTESMKKDLIDNIKNISKKTFVLKNPTINKKKAKSRKFSELPDFLKIKRLVYVGRLSKQKNIPLLCRVMRNLKENGLNVHLDIYGEGDYEGLIRREIEQKTINATLHGFVDKPFTKLSSQDLLVLVSKYEGSPNVIIESMHHGIPIFAVDCPGGPMDIIKSSEFGVLVENNEDIICSKIISILNKGYSLKMLIKASQESIEYSYTRAGQCYIEKLRKLNL